MSEPKTSKRRLEAVEKQRRALEMRKRGTSFDVIASELGYSSRSGAYKAVMSAIEKMLREPAEEVRTLELERLDELLAGLWMKAVKGDAAALDRVLRIMERRSKYLGLDAPKESNVNLGGEVKVTGVPRPLSREEAEVMAKMSGDVLDGGDEE